MIPEQWMKGPLMWAVLAATLLLILVAMVWDLATDQAEQRVRSEQSAQNHMQYAEDRIDQECLRLEPVPLRDCIHQEIESARDHDRANQDLNAQQQMAFFTQVMGYTAVVGLILGAGSIMLIFWTLKATQIMADDTQIMADDTRKIGELQTRPYIVYERGKLKKMQAGGLGTSFLHMDATFRNCGRTPTIITAVSSAAYGPKGDGSWSRVSANWRPVRVVIGSDQIEKIGFDGLAEIEDARFSAFAVGINVWYEALSGEKFEDYVWLYYGGNGLLQDYPDHGFDLYRPEPKGHKQ